MLTGSKVTEQQKQNQKNYLFFSQTCFSLSQLAVKLFLGVSLPPSPLAPAGSVSLGVFLVSVAFVICTIWLVALCGVCTWCQRKLVGRRLIFFFFGIKSPILTVNQVELWNCFSLLSTSSWFLKQQQNVSTLYFYAHFQLKREMANNQWHSAVFPPSFSEKGKGTTAHCGETYRRLGKAERGLKGRNIFKNLHIVVEEPRMSEQKLQSFLMHHSGEANVQRAKLNQSKNKSESWRTTTKKKHNIAL